MKILLLTIGLFEESVDLAMGIVCMFKSFEGRRWILGRVLLFFVVLITCGKCGSTFMVTSCLADGVFM